MASSSQVSGERQAHKDETLFEELGQKVEEIRIGQGQSQEQRPDAGGDSTDGGSVDGNRPPLDEIESLCMNCHENGTTRMLLTRIPFFHEVVLMSFYCPHCHFQNSEIQNAGRVQECGCRYTFILSSQADFSRQIIKSETCLAKFVELDIEIPAGRGQITNVESLLATTINDLEFGQPARKSLDLDVYSKIESIISRGRAMLAGNQFPVTLILDDPAGNSSIQPSANNMDHRWFKTEYIRSSEQNESLSISNDSNSVGHESKNTQQTLIPQLQAAGVDGLEEVDIVPDEIYSFPASCPGCTRPCTTHMKMVDVPHFKEVIIMSTVCDHCSYRSNEVKTGGNVPSQGRRIKLSVQDIEDLARDILKSETCALSCPELNLAVNPGTLGGRFTTVEGLLTQIRDDLHKQVFDTVDPNAAGGDSMPVENEDSWKSFFDRLENAVNAEVTFTLVLEDPLASSYVQNLFAPDPDPQLTIEDYDRTKEEDEELGLNDIKVEGYKDDQSKSVVEGGKNRDSNVHSEVELQAAGAGKSRKSVSDDITTSADNQSHEHV